MSNLRDVYLPHVERRCTDERGKIETTKITVRPDTYDRLRNDARRLDMTRAHLVRILIECWLPILRLVIRQETHGMPGEIGAASARDTKKAGEGKPVTESLEDSIRACAEMRREGGLITIKASFWPKTCRLIAMACDCYDSKAKELIGRLLDVTYEIWR